MTDRGLKLVRFMVITAVAQLLFFQFPVGHGASEVAEKLSGDRRICYFNGEDLSVLGDIFAFRPDANALSVFKKVLEPIGISDPEVFHLRATDVQNAAAAIFGEKRYVFYNQTLITKLASTSGTDWVSVGILAHEIGHHILFHTLMVKSGDVRIKQELAADRYAGIIMRKMNAKLEEAQAAFKHTDELPKRDYPARGERLAAVTCPL